MHISLFNCQPAKSHSSVPQSVDVYVVSDASLISWLKKRAEKKVPAILKPGSKTDKVGLLSNIKHIAEYESTLQ